MIQRDGDKSYAWRVVANKLQKVSLTLGERDPRRGDYVVRAGLAEGDQVIRTPQSTFKDGQLTVSAKPLGAVAGPSAAPVPAASASVSAQARS